MDTAQEALFKAMLTNGWFTASDGHVDSPTGYFGYVTNTLRDNLAPNNREFMSGFGDTIETYGWPKRDELIGSFIANINSDGIIWITKVGCDHDARIWFKQKAIEYSRYDCEHTFNHSTEFCDNCGIYIHETDKA